MERRCKELLISDKNKSRCFNIFAPSFMPKIKAKNSPERFNFQDSLTTTPKLEFGKNSNSGELMTLGSTRCSRTARGGGGTSSGGFLRVKECSGGAIDDGGVQ
jgi:hypothetical protein